MPKYKEIIIRAEISAQTMISTPNQQQPNPHPPEDKEDK